MKTSHRKTSPSLQISRRAFTAEVLRASAAALAAPAIARTAFSAPAVAPNRPEITHGVASGDVSFDRAVIWSRASRESRMIVEWATTESFQNARRMAGPTANEESDFTAKLEFENLPPGERIFYRVQFEDGRALSEPMIGQFITAPRDERDVFF